MIHLCWCLIRCLCACVCIWRDGLMMEQQWILTILFPILITDDNSIQAHVTNYTHSLIHTSNMYAFFPNKIENNVTITMTKHSPSGHTIKKTHNIGIVQVSASRCPPNGICKSRNCFFVLFGPLIRQFFIVYQTKSSREIEELWTSEWVTARKRQQQRINKYRRTSRKKTQFDMLFISIINTNNNWSAQTNGIVRLAWHMPIGHCVCACARNGFVKFRENRNVDIHVHTFMHGQKQDWNLPATDTKV